MRLLSRLKRMPLPRMIALFFTIFSMLPMMTMNLFAYQISTKQAEANVETRMELAAQHVNSDLNMVISEAARLMNFTSSYTISNFLTSKSDAARYETAKAVGQVFTNIRQTQSSNSSILDISAIGINGHCFSERNGYFRLENTFDSYAQFEEVMADPRAIHVQGISQSLRGQRWEENALSVSSAVFKIGTNEITGILRVTVSKSFIREILDNSKPSENGHTLVVDRTGKDLFSVADTESLPDSVLQEILFSDQQKGTLEETNALYVYSVLPSTGWTIISEAPDSEVFSNVYQIRLSTVMMMLASCLFLVITNILLSNYIARPIQRLKTLLQTASCGNLNIEVPSIDGQVEIKELYRSFDVMLQETKKLLNRVVEEQNNLKKSELKALQSQINPHFLYNTLDSAVWAAEIGKTSEVVDLISSLSAFYRLTLRSGMDVVSFDTEVAHVSSYLRIMQMRYQDILTYQIDVAPETAHASFPKIILQAIVENAIYHGVKNRRYPRGGKGLLEICARKTVENTLEITVCDDGIGMDETTLAALHQKIESGELRSGQSYGLINVNMRLRLMFGDAYTLLIHSQPGLGTRVTIRVPVIEEGTDAL